MEKSFSQEIPKKVQEIVDFIKSSEEYQKYLYLENKMKSHPTIPKTIEEIKKLQKEAVQKESQGLDITSIEQRLSSLEKELKDIPLYQDFLYQQENLDYLFTYIKDAIEQLFQF